MQTTLSIANQKILASYAAHKALAEGKAYRCQAALCAVYSLGIVQMMMSGDLADLPTTDEK